MEVVDHEYKIAGSFSKLYRLDIIALENFNIFLYYIMFYFDFPYNFMINSFIYNAIGFNNMFSFFKKF